MPNSVAVKTSPDPFYWPEILYGDSVSANAIFSKVLIRAWEKNTWDLNLWGIKYRNVTLDTAPIVLQAKYEIVDDKKTPVTGGQLYDEWKGKEAVWHLHWLLESPEIHQLMDSHGERFFQWLLSGLKHLWVFLSLLGKTPEFRLRFDNRLFRVLPENATNSSPDAEMLLKAFHDHIPNICLLDDRTAVASASSGIVRATIASRISILLDLLSCTGRASVAEVGSLVFFMQKGRMHTKRMEEIAPELLGMLKRPLSKCDPSIAGHFLRR